MSLDKKKEYLKKEVISSENSNLLQSKNNSSLKKAFVANSYKAKSTLRMIRVNPRKLNLIAKEIRNKNVDDAEVILEGMKKRNALDVLKALKSARANAENNMGLDSGALVVVQATVGPNMKLKRMDIKGRSRMGRIHKLFSQIRIELS